MSNDPKAHLVYGIPLGGAESGFLFTMTDGSHPRDFDRFEARDILLRIVGGLNAYEDYVDHDAWKAASDVANDKVAVHFQPHGGDFACEAMITHKVTVEWGEHAYLDLAYLDHLRRANNWENQIVQACQVLGIDPEEKAPRWMLLASYS